jgi:hypothetical protein
MRATAGQGQHNGACRHSIAETAGLIRSMRRLCKTVKQPSGAKMWYTSAVRSAAGQTQLVLVTATLECRRLSVCSSSPKNSMERPAQSHLALV